MTRPLSNIDPELLRWATDREKEYIAALEEFGGAAAGGRHLGVSKSVIARAMKSLQKRAALAGYAPEYDMRHPVPDGFKVRGVSTYYDRDGIARGQWVKSSADDERRLEIMQAHIDGAKDEISPVEPVPAPFDCDADLLTVYPFGDPHAGLYAWEAETGEGFDLAEFERLQRQAVDRAVDSAPASATALFNDKGDSTHMDNSTNRTRRSGNALDVSGRYAEVVRVSLRVKRYQIARMLEKHEKVVFRLDPGNHDDETALHQSLILEALYENEPRVEVVTSPNKYWYFHFGRVLIGTCHGDGAKGKDLPLIMATDVPMLWGGSDFRTWIVGHVHHKDIKEYAGVDVEFVRTLAAADAWSHGAGHRSKRDLQAITYHKLDGEIERQTSSLRRIRRLAA